jgi:hypothetical protein
MVCQRKASARRAGRGRESDGCLLPLYRQAPALACDACFRLASR